MNEITQENYRSYDAINYSKLKALANHPSLVDREIEMSDAMIMGDLVDTLIYDGEDKLQEKYYISKREQDPSDKVKEIIELATNFENETLLKAAKEIGWGQSWKNDTVILNL